MQKEKQEISIFWFRRDLRLHDNTGLFYALKSGLPVLPLFIFDKNILNKLEKKSDKRVEFIHKTIAGLKQKLNKTDSDIIVEYGYPIDVWKQLFNKYNIRQIFTNNDYEPYALQRDEEVKLLALSGGITFNSYKDQCIFEKKEIVKDDGNPYTVFTPYAKKWKANYYLTPPEIYQTEKYFNAFFKSPSKQPLIPLEDLGFIKTNTNFPSPEVSEDIIRTYKDNRDFPALNNTSLLGIHFRFGTISIRENVRQASVLNETWLNELIWREFYKMILFHFPYVTNGAFKKEYDRLIWRNDEFEFNKWCEGKTGYPIVDAGMRQLNETGYMHNRVRMITASFLTKHLLIDWKWGEAYFAGKLLDYDLSANNGGWQWAAGCGTDAAPYFRIFNPRLQTKKFDPQSKYIMQWVPELNSSSYLEPIVDHEFARKRCLEFYKTSLSNRPLPK